MSRSLVAVVTLLVSAAALLGAQSESAASTCPGELEYGDIVTCSISAPSEQHEFTFETAAEERVLISVNKPVGSSVQVYMAVLTPVGGSTGCTANNSGHFQKECVLPAGNYLL